MSKKIKPRQQHAHRNLVIRDMFLQGGGTPISPNKRVKRAEQRAEREHNEDLYDREDYRPRSRGNDYNEG
jgi:hypothetical protein